MKTLARTIGVLVFACLAFASNAQTPAEPPAREDAREQLKAFLDTHKLRLATSGETAADNFHFTMRMTPPPGAGFPVRKLEFPHPDGTTFTIEDISISEPPAKSVVGLTKEKVSALGLPVREAPDLKTLMDAGFTLFDFPADEKEAALGRKLMELVAEAPRTAPPPAK